MLSAVRRRHVSYTGASQLFLRRVRGNINAAAFPFKIKARPAPLSGRLNVIYDALFCTERRAKTHVAMVTLPQHAARGSPLVTVATAAQRLSAGASGGGTTTLPAELNHRWRRQDQRTRPVCGNESQFRVRSGSGPEASSDLLWTRETNHRSRGSIS